MADGLQHPQALYQRVKSGNVSEVGQMPMYERCLGDNELSYFLPSRPHANDGVNDMYYRVGFFAPNGLITPTRVATAWAIIRLIHPLYACTIKMDPGRYGEARYQYIPPSSPGEAIAEALDNLTICHDKTLDDIVDAHMNGPRRLNPDLTSEIFLLEHPTQAGATKTEYDFVLSMTHYVGDGIALHKSMHQFLLMLGGLDPRRWQTRTEDELAEILNVQWNGRWGGSQMPDYILPPPIEERLPKPKNKFHAKALQVEFQKSEDRYVGGHVFPRQKSNVKKGVNINMSFSLAETETIMSQCKSRKVTMLHALVAICNFAWMKTCKDLPEEIKADPRLPMMMYNSINLRPYLPTPPVSESDMVLALTYFNIMLPSFIPSTCSPHKTFWNRCQNVKRQTIAASKHKMLLQRSQVMNVERGKRARRFAQADDEAVGLIPPRKQLPSPQQVSSPSNSSKPPSLALCGVSHMGNLDHIYQYNTYPDLDLTGIHSTTRKAAGGLLLFSYTFKGRLCFSIGWDKPAFKEGLVERFWANVLSTVDEFMLKGDRLIPESKL